MPNMVRRIARLSVLALVVGVAPAASAVTQGLAPARAEAASAPASHSPAIVQAASETADPGAIRTWIDGAVTAHEQKLEDDRIARAIEADAKKLAPGRYVWRPERAESGPVEIVVSLAAQRAYVFRDRRLIAVTTVSTGREGHRTPTGSFPILEKKRTHFSNLYNNAPMPNMQRMTWDGVALHAGAVMPYAASHGCVRLPMEFSRLLFGVTSIGSVVHVVADEPATSYAALDHATRAAGQAHAQAVARVAERAAARSGATQPARAR